MTWKGKGKGVSTQPSDEPLSLPKSAATFTCFPNLPTELRLEIWQLALSHACAPSVLEPCMDEPQKSEVRERSAAALGRRNIISRRLPTARQNPNLNCSKRDAPSTTTINSNNNNNNVVSCAWHVAIRARYPHAPALAAVCHEARDIVLAHCIPLTPTVAASRSLSCRCPEWTESGWFNPQSDVLLLPRFAPVCLRECNSTIPETASSQGGTSATTATAAGPSTGSPPCPLQTLFARGEVLAIQPSHIIDQLGTHVQDVLAELHRLPRSKRPCRLYWVCYQLTLHGGPESFPAAFAEFGAHNHSRCGTGTGIGAAGTGSTLVSLDHFDALRAFVRRNLVTRDGSSPSYHRTSGAREVLERLARDGQLHGFRMEDVEEQLRRDWITSVMVARSSERAVRLPVRVRPDVAPPEAVEWGQDAPGSWLHVHSYDASHPWCQEALAAMPAFEMVALFRVCPLPDCRMSGWVS